MKAINNILLKVTLIIVALLFTKTFIHKALIYKQIYQKYSIEYDKISQGIQWCRNNPTNRPDYLCERAEFTSWPVYDSLIVFISEMPSCIELECKELIHIFGDNWFFLFLIIILLLLSYYFGEAFKNIMLYKFMKSQRNQSTVHMEQIEIIEEEETPALRSLKCNDSKMISRKPRLIEYNTNN